MVWTVLYSNNMSQLITTNGNDYEEVLQLAHRHRPGECCVYAILKGSHTDTVRFY